MSADPVPNSSGRPGVGAMFARLFRQPAFVTTFAILLVGAIGLNGATEAMSLHFKKEAVPLRGSLEKLPDHLGPWRRVSIDLPLSGDIEHVLGTDKYIFRDYVDTRIVPANMLADLDSLDYRQRKQLFGQLMERYPEATIVLSVTYYTGMVDTVAHIPDRCFVADGFQPTDANYPRWQIAGFPVGSDGWRLDNEGRRVFCPDDKTTAFSDLGLPVRYINFEDQDNRQRKSSRNVAYLFQVNGRYEANPIGVRSVLQNLFQRHGYYAKVETMTVLSDQEKAKKLKRDFLGNALPELEKLLPDWAAATTGSAPATRPTAEAK
jgi:predicted acetyltransferase